MQANIIPSASSKRRAIPIPLKLVFSASNGLSITLPQHGMLIAPTAVFEKI
jgi:hypothetical protein